MMRQAILAGLLALSVVEGLTLAAGAAVDIKPPEGRRIVVFDPATPKALRLQTMQRLGARVLKDLDLIDALVVAVPPAAAEMDVRLRRAPLVLRVDEDLYDKWIEEESFHTLPLPSVKQALRQLKPKRGDFDMPTPMPGVGQPAGDDGSEAPWGIERVNAPKAWKSDQGQGVAVAVVDTGIDFSHPDLAANIAGGFNAINSSATAQDDHGHGTHVSGTVAALLDGNGVVGVAPRARLYGVKVLDANGSGWISDIIAGIDWAVRQKVDVLNMSLGGPRGNDSFHDAVKRAVEAGVTVVCAAGNSGKPRPGQESTVGYPAAYPEAIAVAALQRSSGSVAETIASFSSRGPEVDFIAPGKAVRSTVPGGGYREYSGTSMASPHMAGLAALAVANGAKGPAAVRDVLKAAAKPVAGLGPYEQGAGLPDAEAIAAINIMMEPPPRP